MCTRLKLNRGIITPGMVIQYQLLTASKQGKFGLYNGRVPNVRDDRLTTIWRNLYENNRAIVAVDAFEERGKSFVSPNGILHLAAVCDPEGNIAVVTRDSTPIVAQFHHRMPMIIPGDPEMWLKKGTIWTGQVDLQLQSL